MRQLTAVFGLVLDAQHEVVFAGGQSRADLGGEGVDQRAGFAAARLGAAVGFDFFEGQRLFDFAVEEQFDRFYSAALVGHG